MDQRDLLKAYQDAVADAECRPREVERLRFTGSRTAGLEFRIATLERHLSVLTDFVNELKALLAWRKENDV